MPADNQVVLVGNLADEPDLRFTPTGTPAGSFRLAVTAGSATATAGATWRRRTSASTD